MKGLQRVARRAILTRLKADAGVTALVPAGSIHSQAPLVTPTFPFIKTGGPRTSMRRAVCLDGATVVIPVHAFSRGREAGGALVETAEDHAGRIGEAIEAALDRRGDDVTGARLSYLLGDIVLIVDGGEPDAFHYSCNVTAKVTA